MSEPDSDRILVKKDNLARCAWCGTPESDEWIISEGKTLFCSPECQVAMHAENAFIRGNSGYIVACIGGITLLASVLLALFVRVPPDAVELVAYSIFTAFMCIICGVWSVKYSKEGKKYQDRKGKYRDVSLLVCEYCTQTNPPSATRCRYCGASLTKAMFSYETTPHWIHKHRQISGFICPHCRAIYTYNASSFQSDGTVKCQNCNKPFIPSHPLDLTDESSTTRSPYSDI